MAPRSHCPPLPAPLRPVVKGNGLHLIDEGGRAVAILSPDQLLILAYVRTNQPGDPGEAIFRWPDHRRQPSDNPRRSPAERSGLSRSLSRLHHRGLTHKRFCRQRVILTKLGEAYADWLLPFMLEAAKEQRPYLWPRVVATWIREYQNRQNRPELLTDMDIGSIVHRSALEGGDFSE